MHDDGDIPNVLGEPWLFLSAILLVFTCAVFLMSVALVITITLVRTWAPDQSEAQASFLDQ